MITPSIMAKLIDKYANDLSDHIAESSSEYAYLSAVSIAEIFAKDSENFDEECATHALNVNKQ